MIGINGVLATLLIVTTAQAVVLFVRQQRIMDKLDENAESINDLWNLITQNPAFTVRDEPADKLMQRLYGNKQE